MRIAIEIPDECYANLLDNCHLSSEEIPIISLAIATGTPLPKGHESVEHTRNETLDMAMPIDEAVPILHDMYNYYNDVDVDTYAGFDNEDNNAIEAALKTMHKYQKIQQILKDIPYGGDATVRRIQEVINGNDDN